MSIADKLYAEFMEFNKNWDNYSVEERDVLLKQFKQELNGQPISAAPQ